MALRKLLDVFKSNSDGNIPEMKNNDIDENASAVIEQVDTEPNELGKIQVDVEVLPNSIENSVLLEIEDIPVVFEDQLSAEQFLMPVNIEVNEIPTAASIESEKDTHISTNKLNNNNNLNIPNYPGSNGNLLNEYMFWPKTPERKGKRNCERVSFVLTSSARQKDHIKKMEMKKQELELKEKRKVERLEVRRKKEMEAEIKNKKKNNTFNKRIQKSENNLNQNTNNTVNTDNSDLKDLEKPVLNYTVPERTKRNLFFEPPNNQTKIKILSDLCIRQSDENKNIFKNPTIKTGLCFTCVLNIGSTATGLRCASCSRTYHIKCIFKHFHNIKEDSLFKCSSCLKK